MARILIVDDDPIAGIVTEQLLKKSGYDTDISTHAMGALKTLQKEKFDLVVTDIVMPDMNGIKLIDTIRERHPAMKIIAVSGGGSSYGADCCLTLARDRGAHGMLKKPVEPNKLSEMVQQLLAKT